MRGFIAQRPTRATGWQAKRNYGVMMAEKVTIGNCELWHGDCREVLPLLPPCDLILTDPPYGAAYAANPIVGKGKAQSNHEAMDWDNCTPPPWLFGLLLEKAATVIVWEIGRASC